MVLINNDVRSNFKENIADLQDLITFDSIDGVIDRYSTQLMVDGHENKLRERFGVLIGVVDGFEKHIDEDEWIGNVELTEQEKKFLAWYYIMLDAEDTSPKRNPYQTPFLNNYIIQN